jgi:hypothetical protein
MRRNFVFGALQALAVSVFLVTPAMASKQCDSVPLSDVVALLGLRNATVSPTPMGDLICNYEGANGDTLVSVLVAVSVADAKSRRFYDSTLGKDGHKKITGVGDSAQLGPSQKLSFGSYKSMVTQNFTYLSKGKIVTLTLMLTPAPGPLPEEKFVRLATLFSTKLNADK